MSESAGSGRDMREIKRGGNLEWHAGCFRERNGYIRAILDTFKYMLLKHGEQKPYSDVRLRSVATSHATMCVSVSDLEPRCSRDNKYMHYS